jgi:hypothetical protein
METLFAPELLAAIGLWMGLTISLLIFGLVTGDNGLARVAQFVLVGAALGYATVLAWQNVLRPRLFEPLQATPADWRLWIPLLLGMLLTLAGAERTLRSPHETSEGWRGVLHLLGALPLALILGVAVSLGVIGGFQGTLLPQFLRAAESGLAWRAPVDVFLTGALGLLLTTGVIVHLRSSDGLVEEQPAPLRVFLRGWAWIGKRGLWLAAGMLFIRLFTARLTLLIAELEFLVARLEQTSLWRLAEQIWRGLF